MRDQLLTKHKLEEFIADVRAEIEASQEKPPQADAAKLEKELSRLRGEQKRYAAALASAPDVPEILVELKRRQERIRVVERDLAAARCTPEVQAGAVASIEGMIRQKWAELHASLTNDRDSAREVLRTLFPDGLHFEPHDPGHTEKAGPKGGRPPSRRVWAISSASPRGLFQWSLATPAGI